MRHSQKVFSKSCLRSRAAARKSGAAGLLLAVTLAGFTPAHLARAGLTFQLLYEFQSSVASPRFPLASLVQGSDGNFYGTTERGGSFDGGTVFKITPGGVLTTLHSFSGSPDGDAPTANLLQGNDGNFYGTTHHGGSGHAGTVFKITLGGVLTTLVSFDGSNGRFPGAGLVQGSDGNFYGTTQGNGISDFGSVFQTTPDGSLTALFSFNSWTDPNGTRPYAGLVQGTDGNLYGNTSEGGANNSGTVFKITPNGTFTSLLSFNGTNGYDPRASLVQGNDNSFYGTTVEGGLGYGLGTVFKITTNGILTTLLSFDGTNGAFPYAGLKGSDGNFYGTTTQGGVAGYNPAIGNYGNGTVFMITTNGALTTLFSFNGTNGSGANGLVQASDGNFYGTTELGGAYDGGTIFRLVQPPVITAITDSSGTVTITWTSFTDGIYRVEYKPSLGAASWTALTPDVTATGSTASFTDSPGSDTERYYRIVLPLPPPPIVDVGVLAGPVTNVSNGHVYYLLTENTWTASQAKAVTLGGNLATIRNEAENSWVYANFSEFGGVARGLWIGLNDAASEGNFVWVSGEAVSYRNWDVSEPNNFGGNENYAHLFWPGDPRQPHWNDAPDMDRPFGIPINGVVEIVPKP